MIPGKAIVNQHQQQQKELYTKFDNIGNDHRQRDYQPGKINFAKNSRVTHKSVRGSGKAGRKIVPDGNTTHIERYGINAVRGNPGYYTKHNQKHKGGEDGLDKMPYRSKNSLFVGGDKIPFYKEHQQVPVFPYLAQPDVKQGGFRSYFFGPVLGRCCFQLIVFNFVIPAVKSGISVFLRHYFNINLLLSLNSITVLLSRTVLITSF
jgi:hypothetical protein